MLTFDSDLLDADFLICLLLSEFCCLTTPVFNMKQLLKGIHGYIKQISTHFESKNDSNFYILTETLIIKVSQNASSEQHAAIRRESADLAPSSQFWIGHQLQGESSSLHCWSSHSIYDAVSTYW